MDTASVQSYYLSISSKNGVCYRNVNVDRRLFLGIPLVISFCLAAHAVRDMEPRYWFPAFSLFAYCGFYVHRRARSSSVANRYAPDGGGWVNGGALGV